MTYNLRKVLEEQEQTSGETIEAMVVGKHYTADWEAEPLPDENVVLSRERGLAKVDQDYDNGYGGADCFPLYAWTQSRIYFVHEYDGSTCLAWLPRDPGACAPGFGGS